MSVPCLSLSSIELIKSHPRRFFTEPHLLSSTRTQQNLYQLCGSPQFNRQIRWQRKCCSDPLIMAQSMEYWWGTVSLNPRERIRKEEGLITSARIWHWLVQEQHKGINLTMYQELKCVSLNGSHNSTFSLSCMWPYVFLAHHRQSASWFSTACLHPPTSAHALLPRQWIPSPW